MKTEREYEDRSDHYANPAEAVEPVGAALTGADAEEAGSNFLKREWGNDSAMREDIRRGRPRIGEAASGNSPVVRTRLAAQDFAAFKQLEHSTGKSQAELVREGVHLLLEQHRLAS